MGYTWSFSTSADGQSASAFRILAFIGEDAVCQGYTFDILLLVENLKEEDAPAFLQAMAEAATHTLTGSTNETSVLSFAWSGMPERVEWMFAATGGGAVLRVLLRPHSFKLRHSVHSRIFLGVTPPKLLEYLLIREGLSSNADFVAGLKTTYKSRPLSCQYNESAFDFLQRHLERLGGYSYIDQNAGKSRLVLADDGTTVPALTGRSALDWDPTTTTDTAFVVFSFVRTMATSATSVTLRDYCTEKPGSEAQTYTPPAVTINGGGGNGGSGSGGNGSGGNGSGDSSYAPLRGGGAINLHGRFNMFGEVNNNTYSASDAQAQALLMAKARARSLVSLSNRIRGASTVAWMRAGYYFTLSNKSYQLLSVSHACNCRVDSVIDVTNISRAIVLGFPFNISQAGYSNSFVCHPLELGAYAPEAATPRPVVSGLMQATIYASSDAGSYADLDVKGRYTVSFPFAEAVYDANNAAVGSSATVPLRLMQIHAGKNSGIHFPLLGNTEALVAFTDGDPDRPVIL
ncbi:MAG: hypothetical protein LBP61_06995, partial [Desulfovibrio sp.]|nr:hypothetical protein [Desulfovibrio sp.]